MSLLVSSSKWQSVAIFFTLIFITNPVPVRICQISKGILYHHLVKIFQMLLNLFIHSYVSGTLFDILIRHLFFMIQTVIKMTNEF